MLAAWALACMPVHLYSVLGHHHQCYLCNSDDDKPRHLKPCTSWITKDIKVYLEWDSAFQKSANHQGLCSKWARLPKALECRSLCEELYIKLYLWFLDCSLLFLNLNHNRTIGKIHLNFPTWFSRKPRGSKVSHNRFLVRMDDKYSIQCSRKKQPRSCIQHWLSCAHLFKYPLLGGGWHELLCVSSGPEINQLSPPKILQNPRLSARRTWEALLLC